MRVGAGKADTATIVGREDTGGLPKGQEGSVPGQAPESRASGQGRGPRASVQRGKWRLQ